MRLPSPRTTRGYTVIELLVVLVIVAVLAAGFGTYSLWPRQRPTVKTLLNEIEGLLAESHQYASTSLGNVVVQTDGSWASRTYQLSYRPKTATDPVNRIRADAFEGREYAGVDTGGLMGTAVGAETLLAAIQANTPALYTDFNTALATPLTTPGATVEINAYNKQFLTPFCIPVVGMTRNGTYAGAPAGYVIVVGNRIYKYYKAGPGTGNPWRRM